MNEEDYMKQFVDNFINGLYQLAKEDGEITDNRTIELLREGLTERGIEYAESQDRFRTRFRFNYCEACGDYLNEIEVMGACITASKSYLTPEQAIAATLGKPKAKSHPYGYEPDTGAFDRTRCKCGCINDISATYCNDCGGEIEVDMNAEKELYHTLRHLVFAEKHDDGSLEFGGKRYIAATLGSERKSYDAGFNSGVKATLQQLDGLICSGYDLKAVCAWVNIELENGDTR